MTRPEAIEAAARAQFEQGGVDWDVANGRAKNAARRGAEKALTAAAPHIESALLDRIEEAVKGERLTDETGHPSDEGYNLAIEHVLAILTEIRQEVGK